MDPTPIATRIPRQTGITAAVCAVLASGLIEVCIVAIERRFDPLLRVSADFVWMAPAGLAAIALVAGLACWLVSALSRRTGTSLLVFAAVALAILNLLLLVKGLSHYAAAALAGGGAVQTVRLMVRHPAAIQRLLRVSWPALSCGLLLLGSWISLSSRYATPRTEPGSRGPSARPNVLLMTLDTVRAGNMSLYGYPRDTTPALVRFSQRGVAFDRAFATAPWTLPSHASLFTGRWPHELSADATSPLDGAFPTLAEYLGKQGYATAGFAANLGYCSLASGLGRGFDHYEDYPRSWGQLVSSSTLLRTIANNFTLRRVVSNDQHLNRVSAAELNSRVLRWLTQHGDSPFFVFMNYFDAHEPYLPPPDFDSRFGPARPRGRYSPLHHWLWDASVGHRAMAREEIREEQDAYDGALAYLDDQIGRLLMELDRRRMLDNTLVVITSDHGEEFGEHDLFDHGYSLYRQALQVPLLIVKPGRVAAGRRVGEVVSLRDIPATVLDVLGFDPGAPFPGESLASFWSEEGDNRERLVIAEVERARGQPEWFPASKGSMSALVHRGVHYIRNGDGTEELYDLARDPAENSDVASLAAYAPSLAESRNRLQDVLRNGTLAAGPTRAGARSPAKALSTITLPD